MNRVSVIMGSISDWPTMKEAVAILEQFEVTVETHIISAHRMPTEMATYAANAREAGVDVIIAGAGGAAHLPGMVAAQTTLPVIGVPMKTKALNGVDSLLSIVQMPAVCRLEQSPLGRLGLKCCVLRPNAVNHKPETLATQLETFREQQAQKARESEEQLHD